MSILVFLINHVKVIVTAIASLLLLLFYKKTQGLKEEKKQLEINVDKAKSIVNTQQQIITQIKNAKRTDSTHASNVKLMYEEKL